MPRRAADLHDHLCVGVHATNGRAEWRLASHRGSQRVRVACGAVADDMRFAAALASEGGGIALLPLLTAGPFVSAGRLVRVLPSLAVRDVPLRLVSPKRGLEPMAARLFREGLLREPWARGA